MVVVLRTLVLGMTLNGIDTIRIVHWAVLIFGDEFLMPERVKLYEVVREVCIRRNDPSVIDMVTELKCVRVLGQVPRRMLRRVVIQFHAKL